MRRSAAASLLILLAAFGVASARPVAAQELARVRKSGKPPANSIAAVADKLAWDGARLGPLVIVAPERLRPRTGNPMLDMMGQFDPGDFEDAPSVENKIPEALKPRPLPAAGPGGYRLETLAEAVGRRVLRTGRVHTLAPVDVAKPVSFKEMLGGNMEAMMGDMGSDDGLLIFLASLDKGQWALATSPQGIGPEALDPRQRTQFQRLVPPMTSIWFPKGTAPQRTLPEDPESAFSKLFSGGTPDPKALREVIGQTLPAEVVASFRLRIRRDVSVSAVPVRSGTTVPDLAGEQAPMDIDVPPAADRWDQAQIVLREEAFALMEKSFGLVMGLGANRIPAAPKRTDLDPKSPSLQVAISLAGAKTVGDLVARIAEATRLPVLCDARIGTLGVLVRGETAPAGDVLAAILRGLHGAVRRLDDGQDRVYLVVEDVVPQGRRGDGMPGDLGDITARRRGDTQAGRRARIALAARNALADIPRGESNGLPEAAWTLAETANDQQTVALADLPQPYRDKVAEWWKEMPIEVKSTQLPPERATAALRVAAEMVSVSTGAWFSVATVDAADLRPDKNRDTPVPPVVWDTDYVARGLALAPPADPAALDALLALARARGFTHWWIDVPVQGGTSEVERWSAVAKAHGMKVVPVLRPLRGDSAHPEQPRDRNAAGLTVREWARSPQGKFYAGAIPGGSSSLARLDRGDFLIPEAVDPIAIVVRIANLAAVPGIERIALADLASPGYWDGSSDGPFEGWKGGVTTAARVRFARTARIDPADLGGNDFNPFAGLDSLVPQQTDYSIRAAWDKDLAARRDAMLGRIDLLIKRSPVSIGLLQHRPELGEFEQWTGKWSDGDSVKPGAKAPAPTELRWDVATLDEYRQMFEAGVRDDEPDLLRPEEERFAAWVNERFGPPAPDEELPEATPGQPGADTAADVQPVNAFLLDLSAESPEAALAFLRDRIAPQGPPAPAKPNAGAKPTPGKQPGAGAAKPPAASTGSAPKAAAPPSKRATPPADRPARPAPPRGRRPRG